MESEWRNIKDALRTAGEEQVGYKWTENRNLVGDWNKELTTVRVKMWMIAQNFKQKL